jgi:hypothetical protein
MSRRVLSAKWDVAHRAWVTSLIGFVACLSTSVDSVKPDTDAEAVDVTTLDEDALAAWVDARTAEYAVTDEDRSFDRIGWAPDIRHAERLSRDSGRPVFLFTHDGRIHTGRC